MWFLVVFDSDFHAQTMSATDDVMKIAENIVCVLMVLGWLRVQDWPAPDWFMQKCSILLLF